MSNILKATPEITWTALLIGAEEHRSLLNRLGYHVLFAQTGEVALDFLVENAKGGVDGSAVGIDVVVIDAGIPDRRNLWAKLGAFPEAWEAICFMLGDESSGGHIELPLWNDRRGAEEKIIAALCFSSRLIGS